MKEPETPQTQQEIWIMEFKEDVNNSWRVHRYNVANIFHSAVFA